VCCMVQREGVGAESHVKSVLSAGRAEAAHDGEFDGSGDERRRAHPRPDRRLQRDALRVRDSRCSHARKPPLEVAPTTYISNKNSTDTEHTCRCYLFTKFQTPVSFFATAHLSRLVTCVHGRKYFPHLKFPLFDCELLSMIWTLEFVLDMVKLNLRDKFLDQRSFGSNVIVRTDTHSVPIARLGPLK